MVGCLEDTITGGDHPSRGGTSAGGEVRRMRASAGTSVRSPGGDPKMRTVLAAPTSAPTCFDGLAAALVHSRSIIGSAPCSLPRRGLRCHFIVALRVGRLGPDRAHGRLQHGKCLALPS